MNFGFVKVATAIPSVRVADCSYNATAMVALMQKAANERAEIFVAPELGVTSCSCGDLFHRQHLLSSSEEALQTILAATADSDTIYIIGIPLLYCGKLLNCAVALHKGTIVGAVAKEHLGREQERWFVPSSAIADNAATTICGQRVRILKNAIFATKGYTFAIEIGEDLWAPSPRSTALAIAGAQIIVNPAASNEEVGRKGYTESLISVQSARCNAAYIHSCCGYGESSGDKVYTGNAIIAENGKIIAQGKRFSTEEQMIISEIDTDKINYERMSNALFKNNREAVETIYIHQENNTEFSLTRKYSATPFIPNEAEREERCEEIFSIQAAGLAKRIEHTHAQSCVIGISGGLDSTLALLVAVRAFDILKKERKGIVAVTMPGFGTTDRTYNNALLLMKSLGVTIREISIKAACLQHFSDIGHDASKHDVTYENSQARERTQILMDIANQTNGFVIGTGDLSELALGWATYNGDHMSMYGVNASIPKTLVRYLVEWVANSSNDKETRTTLLDIAGTPISPELIPADEQGNIAQKTEDLVGPYELHDFFLYHTLRSGFTPKKIFAIANSTFDGVYDRATIKKWLTTFTRRFFNQQFKRSCMPDGPKVGSCSLSPRGDWQMPSDASSASWLAECDEL